MRDRTYPPVWASEHRHGALCGYGCGGWVLKCGLHESVDPTPQWPSHSSSNEKASAVGPIRARDAMYGVCLDYLRLRASRPHLSATASMSVRRVPPTRGYRGKAHSARWGSKMERTASRLSGRRGRGAQNMCAGAPPGLRQRRACTHTGGRTASATHARSASGPLAATSLRRDEHPRRRRRWT